MKSKIKYLHISCDGAGGTGKSTGAELISKKYNLKFLSSGLLYRYAASQLLKYKPKNEMIFLKKKFKNFDFRKLKKLNLHTPKISDYSSHIAKKKNIRDILKKIQKDFSKKNRKCCIEGRDISTKILPKSDVKFYFYCSLNIAALRRYKQIKKFDKKIKFSDVKKALRKRNFLDVNRKNSPLLKHADSISIDTGKLNKSEMLKKMSFYIDLKLKKKYGN